MIPSLAFVFGQQRKSGMRADNSAFQSADTVIIYIYREICVLLTGVATTMMGEVMVADSKNKRIQTFTRRKLFKDSFDTNDEPCSLTIDIHYNVIVATTKKTIEIYRRGGKLINRFGTFPGRDQVPTSFFTKTPHKIESPPASSGILAEKKKKKTFSPPLCMATFLIGIKPSGR